MTYNETINKLVELVEAAISQIAKKHHKSQDDVYQDFFEKLNEEDKK